jgi:hypothetical protein
MSTPPNLHREKLRIIRLAAGVASGDGQYDLANRLWAYEADLRERGRPVLPELPELDEPEDEGQPPA